VVLEHLMQEVTPAELTTKLRRAVATKTVLQLAGRDATEVQ
jgi:hypothetical protein